MFLHSLGLSGEKVIAEWITIKVREKSDQAGQLCSRGDGHVTVRGRVKDTADTNGMRLICAVRLC